jgi:hypothetical protein
VSKCLHLAVYRIYRDAKHTLYYQYKLYPSYKIINTVRGHIISKPRRIVPYPGMVLQYLLDRGGPYIVGLVSLPNKQ